MTEKIKIFAVVGPTASGKSALALELAKRHGGEIISCDSMQVYKRMDIGTAKPTADEQRAVRHHLIDVVEPDVSFSSEDYVELASKAIEDCASRGKIPIVCGGTGLYLDALLRGGNSAEVKDTSDIRAMLTERAERDGVQAIHRELASVDPESAAEIHPNNVKRVIRALEIYYSCGVPKSELDRASRELEPKYDANVLWLSYSDREILYSRIEKRVDEMIREGLLFETEKLMNEGVFEKNGTAAQAIGYKELLGYFKGEKTLEMAITDLKTSTRRYAKRQITWFSAKKYAVPLEVDCGGSIKRFEEIVNNAQNLFSL
ncbi:MAG: tRNA (adenosine(37)-N6)-dimethylallyltransferase MiaA [Ruminococcaceae bacterium]|nr:tRNA (adenosine(37)-N6)-dimethylallyltransferase MiaA [Oscillospiraceae bacterium]